MSNVQAPSPKPFVRPQPFAHSLYACIFHPPAPDNVIDRDARKENNFSPLVAIAAQFSPRYEAHGDDLVSIDVSGLERLLGPAQAIGEELRRTAAARADARRRALRGVAGSRVAD